MDPTLKKALATQIYLLALRAAKGGSRQEAENVALGHVQKFLSDLNGGMLAGEDIEFSQQIANENQLGLINSTVHIG